jgi:hypothetical protein
MKYFSNGKAFYLKNIASYESCNAKLYNALDDKSSLTTLNNMFLSRDTLRAIRQTSSPQPHTWGGPTKSTKKRRGFRLPLAHPAQSLEK